MNQNESKQIINANQLVDKAYIDLAQSDAPQLIRKITIDLENERTLGNALKLNFAFKSLYVFDATDSAVEINFIPFNNSETTNIFPLKKNGVLNWDLPIRNALFTWDAQTGKSVTLVFILNGSFRPGSLFTEVSSSVEGNSINTKSPVNVTTTATVISAQSNDKKVVNVQNDSGVTIYLGNSGVTTTNGIKLLVGASVIIKNTAALYGIVGSGTASVRVMEEE